MVAPAVAASIQDVRPRATGWIIGRGADLTWLIGGALVAYALLAAHLFLGVAAVTIYMTWVLAIDGPHVFATLSRTYLDERDRVAHAALLRASLCLFAVGPVAVMLSVLVGRRLPYDLFLAFATLWAYWHVVRQHYGVMVLYKRKARDTDRGDDRGDDRVDESFLYAGLLAPIASYMVTSQQALAMVGVDHPPAWAPAVTVVAWALVAAAAVVLVARQVIRSRSGRAPNWPKLLFMVAAVSVSAVLFSPWVAVRIDYGAVFPIVTSFHNVQYLAIVWFFHGNRRSGADPTQPTVFARTLWAFLAAGLAFTVVYRVLLGCLFSAWPGCDVGAENVALPAGLTASDLGISFLWGFALHHYYLDQRIWHVRRDEVLGRDLRLDVAG